MFFVLVYILFFVFSPIFFYPCNIQIFHFWFLSSVSVKKMLIWLTEAWSSIWSCHTCTRQMMPHVIWVRQWRGPRFSLSLSSLPLPLLPSHHHSNNGFCPAVSTISPLLTPLPHPLKYPSPSPTVCHWRRMKKTVCTLVPLIVVS